LGRTKFNTILEKGVSMKHPDSLKHHIEHLENSHHKLDKDLMVLERLHENDTVTAHELKKRKLMIKDELTRCRQTLSEMLK
jgi:hypothetical protein